MKFAFRDFAWLICGIIFIPVILLCAFVYGIIRVKRKKCKMSPRLMFGPNPIISNKYWSEALSEIGLESKTLMKYYFPIQNNGDFNHYYENISYFKHGSILGNLLNPFVIIAHIIVNYDIIHIPITGSCEFGRTPFWFLEKFIFQIAQVKTVSLPYGGDFYNYSKILDKSWAFAMNINYPKAAREEMFYKKRLNYWTSYSDFFIPTFMLDGVGRMDALIFSHSMIDVQLWNSKKIYSKEDGVKGTVNIIHTPNHRGAKGTEFLIAAVDRLKMEGFKVKLILLEKISNLEVQRIMIEEADILAEQFIATAYAMSGVEGLATGLPVLSNLENNDYTEVYKRYSYLNECPIVSTKPETIYLNLKELVTNPQLREELGKKGRIYAEKYHSYKTTQFLFPKIYDRIWYKKEVDFTGMFHPLNPNSYNNLYPNV